MRRHLGLATVLAAALLASSHGGGGVAPAAAAEPPGHAPTAASPSPGAVAILQALRDDPVTAPYRFAVSQERGQYVLSGRVGTRTVHDVAVRTVIALGYPVRDDLTIDTAEAARVAGVPFGAPGPARLPFFYRGGGAGYVYPPPLFGRLDNPFFGFEPPLLSYPPWFGAMSARRAPLDLGVLNPGLAPAVSAPPQAAAGGVASVVEPGQATPGTGGRILPQGIEMTLDPRGVATLRGTVPTLADRVAVGQEVARTPGVTEVVNLLQVASDGPTGAPSADQPPPPPAPLAARPAPAPHAEGAAVVVEPDPLARRVLDAIARRPALTGSPLKVTSSRDGVVTLAGRVPSAYEAMLAFRAAQQTPGVAGVTDRLEFPPPEVGRPNPLKEKGRPEDVEPYLFAHARRQLGDLAHVDSLRVQGDTVEIRGTVSRADDVARVEAALRSIPLLRTFRLDPQFVTD